MRQRHLLAKLLISSLAFAGFSSDQSCSSGVAYELAWIFRGHGARGDYRFGSHGPGDDQVPKGFRLCDAAFLQAGYSRDDYPIRM